MTDIETIPLTWTEFAVVCATGHAPNHKDCARCDARTYQAVCGVAWAQPFRRWWERGWSGWWNVPYEAVQLRRRHACGCLFNVGLDGLMLQERARVRAPDPDAPDNAIDLVLEQVDEMFEDYKRRHACPKQGTLF